MTTKKIPPKKTVSSSVSKKKAVVKKTATPKSARQKLTAGAKKSPPRTRSSKRVSPVEKTPVKTATKKTVKASTPAEPQAVKPEQPPSAPELKQKKQDSKKQPNKNSVWQDYSAFTDYMGKISGKGQNLIGDFLKTQPTRLFNKVDSPTDPLNVSGTMQNVFAELFADPANIMRMQFGMWQDYAKLSQNMAQKMSGKDAPPIAEPAQGDRRFAHKAWDENQTLDFIKQSYLIMSHWAREMVAKADNLDDHTRKKAMFYTEQFLAAVAPTNFPSTNPQVMEETLKTNGENFVKGFKNFLEDMERGDGELAMRQVDLDYFKLGENIATSPGKVIYQNDIIQLIQYAPTTDKVARRPLVIFPPFINKFYILDLQPENSLISWLVGQGRTVFVVSWVNPGPELSGKSFEDYMFEGVYGAIDAVEQATGEREVDTIGYCIGGTLLACALAHMAEKKDDRIKTVTFFTAQMDFVEAGELLLFVDDEQLNNIEKKVDASGGILKGAAMAQTFNMLRPTDLIWSVYVDNYLLGHDPKQFDLLFWNSDSTAMPKAVYLYYLRQFYQHNKLAENKLTMAGVKLDLSKVKIPVFMQSGEKDHIAPYRSIYRSARLFGGDTTFMLAGSGHIAGVINHPDKKKYHFRINESLPDTVEEWLDNTTQHEHSWWPYWMQWLSRQSLISEVPARQPGSGKLPPLEDAPGSYVKKKG